MASPEDIFASMKLGVVVPEAFHDLPDDADESWLLEAENEAQREKAFFGVFFCWPWISRNVITPL